MISTKTSKKSGSRSSSYTYPKFSFDSSATVFSLGFVALHGPHQVAENVTCNGAKTNSVVSIQVHDVCYHKDGDSVEFAILLAILLPNSSLTKHVSFSLMKETSSSDDPSSTNIVSCETGFV